MKGLTGVAVATLSLASAHAKSAGNYANAAFKAEARTGKPVADY